MVSADTYRIIQAWIGRQLEYEAAHSAPPPLTDVQRKLLGKLEQTIPPEKPPPPEPDAGETNWIGLLMEDRAARQRGPSTNTGVNFVETPGPVILGVQKWYCQAQIDECPSPFPNAEGGLLENGTLPCFARKKDAKKYAAKCAFEWLRAKRSAPQANNNGTASSQVQKQPATPQTSMPERKKPRLSGPEPEQDKTKSDAVEEVKLLCKRLGFPDMPSYVITQSAEQSGFFSGHADMGMLATALPVGCGRVEGVLGKKLAKQKIAEGLLAPLRNMAEPHDEAYQQFIKKNPHLEVKENKNQ
ncbi:hypothetical protein GGR52DRAFT_529292 [Hypoxylon sp. FL1284]|nr:hypothetical protein GGR52DRAFT_529292 [Hypoxylon sp. FL1284]